MCPYCHAICLRCFRGTCSCSCCQELPNCCGCLLCHLQNGRGSCKQHNCISMKHNIAVCSTQVKESQWKCTAYHEQVNSEVRPYSMFLCIGAVCQCVCITARTPECDHGSQSGASVLTMVSYKLVNQLFRSLGFDHNAPIAFSDESLQIATLPNLLNSLSCTGHCIALRCTALHCACIAWCSEIN